MMPFILRLLGNRAIHRAAGKHNRGGGPLDLRFGLNLLRDRRIPAKYKISALLLGMIALMLLNILDAPLEMLMALTMPLVGIPLDIAINGMELIVVPLVIAGLAVMRLAPPALVETLRSERQEVLSGPVIDVRPEPVTANAR